MIVHHFCFASLMPRIDFNEAENARRLLKDFKQDRSPSYLKFSQLPEMKREDLKAIAVLISLLIEEAFPRDYKRSRNLIYCWLDKHFDQWVSIFPNIKIA